MSKLRIEVTERHIEHGLRNNCEDCPIGMALQGALNLPKDRIVTVDVETVAIRQLPQGNWGFKKSNSFPAIETAELPPEAIAFIETFDRGFPVKPFTFDLTFVPCSQAT